MTRVWINGPFDTFEAQRRIKSFASELGFPRRACHELAIVVSELSSNILKYGRCGRVELEKLHDTRGNGLAVHAYDFGPPFRDFDCAVEDFCDDAGPIDPDERVTRTGTGTGLGAVARLTHRLLVESQVTGKRVTAIRYLGEPLKGATR